MSNKIDNLIRQQKIPIRETIGEAEGKIEKIKEIVVELGLIGADAKSLRRSLTIRQCPP